CRRNRQHSTAGHGGFVLSPEANAQIPAAFRSHEAVYEEDSEWAKVALGYPKLFTDYERRHADKTLRDGYPDEYEAHYQVTIP
ncbi:DUF7007 domain-containing protein, partial [Klebsiella aerogenes]|uniref:DUF7007 domain-containing protein n=1 Tax=Klebsiella aerogenes TaxID=548 RepID=UPI001953B464